MLDAYTCVNLRVAAAVEIVGSKEIKKFFLDLAILTVVVEDLNSCLVLGMCMINDKGEFLKSQNAWHQVFPSIMEVDSLGRKCYRVFK
jgi:hypothetical protein